MVRECTWLALPCMTMVVLILCCAGAARGDVKSDRWGNWDAQVAQRHVKEPPFRGRRYETLVPDTLDLAERARLALNAVTRTLEPARDYEMYFVTEFRANPPILNHTHAGLICTGKYLEVLPMLRLMTGSDFNLDVDHKLMETYLHGTGKDGLFYVDVEGKPWRLYPGAKNEPWSEYYTEGRGILALCRWYQRDGDPFWKALAERKIDRLLQMGYRDGDGLRYPVVYHYGDAAPTSEPAMGSGDNLVPFGPLKYYELTGYKPALELARGEVKAAAKLFESDGTFRWAHFHLSCVRVMEMLDYGILVNDREIIDHARKAYEYARTAGQPLVGFFPEDIWPNHSYKTSEGCAVADMVELAVKLSRSGIGDYWDDVDRYTRNHFAEMQLTSVGQLDWEELTADQNADTKYRMAVTVERAHPGEMDTTDALDRTVGSWAGWATGNDYNGVDAVSSVMQCCLGNGARALYYVWDSIVTADGDAVKVNLLLNRAAPWLDINSYIPYEGRVDIKIRKPCAHLDVRIPEWVKPQEMKCTVAGDAVPLTFDGRYARVGSVRKGDVVVMSFPIQERRVTVPIGTETYKLVIKGNDVVAIDPPGQWCPLYQRAHYRESQVRWVKRTRFVPDRLIAW